MFFSNFQRCTLLLLIALTTTFSQQVNDPNNMVTNGGFDAGEQDVVYKLIHGAAGGFTIVDGQLVCEAKSGIIYDCQLWKMPLNIENGKTYFISFDAKADADREFEFSIERVGGGYTHYGDAAGTGAKANLTTTMQTFTRTFTMASPTDAGARLTVSIGGKVSTVTFDNFIIIDKSKITAIRANSMNAAVAGNSLRIDTDLTGLSFHVSNPAHFGFRIYSPSGRVVANSAGFSPRYASQSHIDYRSLGVASGMYVAHVFDGAQRYSTSFFVIP
jgi:hypothetical protein